MRASTSWGGASSAIADKATPAVRLHLSVEKGVDLDHRQGQSDLPARPEPGRGPRAAPAHRALRGWTTYFRPGVSFTTFAVSARLHLASGDASAAPQAPPDHLEGTPPPLLRRRLVAHGRRRDPVQPDSRGHDPLPRDALAIAQSRPTRVRVFSAGQPHLAGDHLDRLERPAPCCRGRCRAGSALWTPRRAATGIDSAAVASSSSTPSGSVRSPRTEPVIDENGRSGGHQGVDVLDGPVPDTSSTGSESIDTFGFGRPVARR